jgi:hypothetical protein
MDITPTPMGAMVDVTDEAVPAVIEAFADAFEDNETFAARLLLSLAEARSVLRRLKADAAAGRDVSDVRLEQAACAVDGIRDALVALLSPGERVTVQLTADGCRTDAARLAAAAVAAENRFRTPGQAFVPHQWEREDAA